MCHAITQLHQDPRALEEDTSNPESELVLLGTYIRGVILRSFSPADKVYEPKPFQAADDASYAAHDTLDHPAEIGAEHWGIFKDDMRIQSWARRHLRVNPVRVEGDPELHGLNATQIRAIAMMVGQRMTLIHGVRTDPPLPSDLLIMWPSFCSLPEQEKVKQSSRRSGY